jgi:uncharacterized protein (DUF3084 family)
MKDFWAKILSLSTPVKIALGIVILVVGLFIFDAFTGYVRNFKNWAFDRHQAQIEQQNQELLNENKLLREDNAQLRVEQTDLVKKAVEAKAREAVFEEREKNLDTKTKQELAKTDAALKQQDVIEQQTAQDTDVYTRCVRTKEKLLAQNIPSAKNIRCEDFPHE